MIRDQLEALNEQANELVRALDKVDTEKLGLDPRAAYGIRVSHEDGFLAVPESEDRTMQYYGGFEYVDAEFRSEAGDFVLYSVDQCSDSCRVQECLDMSSGKYDNMTEEEDA